MSWLVDEWQWPYATAFAACFLLALVPIVWSEAGVACDADLRPASRPTCSISSRSSGRPIPPLRQRAARVGPERPGARRHLRDQPPRRLGVDPGVDPARLLRRARPRPDRRLPHRGERGRPHARRGGTAGVQPWPADRDGDVRPLDGVVGDRGRQPLRRLHRDKSAGPRCRAARPRRDSRGDRGSSVAGRRSRGGTRAAGAFRSRPPPRRRPRRGLRAACRAAWWRAGRRPGRCPPSCSSRSRS